VLSDRITDPLRFFQAVGVNEDAIRGRLNSVVTSSLRRVLGNEQLLQVLSADDRHALACLDARMGELYWGCFAADAEAGVIEACPPQVGPPDSVAIECDRRYAGVGRGFSAYPMLAEIPGVMVTPERALALPNAREIARLGALRFAAGHGVDPAELRPLYLRDKVALTEAERAAQ